MRMELNNSVNENINKSIGFTMRCSIALDIWECTDEIVESYLGEYIQNPIRHIAATGFTIRGFVSAAITSKIKQL